MTPISFCTRPASDPRNGPVWLRSELLDGGHSDRSIARLVRDGDLARVRHGAYAAGPAWRALDEVGRLAVRGRAVLKASGTTLALSHVSGLPELGAPTWGFDLSRVHTTRTDGLSGRRAPDVKQHEGRVGPGDLVVVNGVPMMSPARIGLECAMVGGLVPGLCVVNHLLHMRLTTPADLNAQYVGMENWRDSRAIELVLRLADGRIESVGETRAFCCCFHYSLPMPVPQFEIRDRGGRVVARLDLAWPHHGVWLEFDGRIKYEDLLRPGQRASDVVFADRQRERMIHDLTGWICIRITWADLADPARLADLIRRELFRTAA